MTIRRESTIFARIIAVTLAAFLLVTIFVPGSAAFASEDPLPPEDIVVTDISADDEVGDVDESVIDIVASEVAKAAKDAKNARRTEAGTVVPTEENTVEALASSSAIIMYRLYNPNTTEHFYTASYVERDYLIPLGWEYEGIGWYAPDSGDPVYRMYNPYSGDHHYTLGWDEVEYLEPLGWIYEGIGWNSDPNRTVPLYRAFNPYEQTGTHNYTASIEEQNHITSIGWIDEGIGWYGVN